MRYYDARDQSLPAITDQRSSPVPAKRRENLLVAEEVSIERDLCGELVAIMGHCVWAAFPIVSGFAVRQAASSSSVRYVPMAKFKAVK